MEGTSFNENRTIDRDLKIIEIDEEGCYIKKSLRMILKTNSEESNDWAHSVLVYRWEKWRTPKY